MEYFAHAWSELVIRSKLPRTLYRYNSYATKITSIYPFRGYISVFHFSSTKTHFILCTTFSSGLIYINPAFHSQDTYSKPFSRYLLETFLKLPTRNHTQDTYSKPFSRCLLETILKIPTRNYSQDTDSKPFSRYLLETILKTPTRNLSRYLDSKRFHDECGCDEIRIYKHKIYQNKGIHMEKISSFSIIECIITSMTNNKQV